MSDRSSQTPELDTGYLDANECWQAVERLAGSRLFKRAVRSREFLLYVSRRTLKAGCSEVREQEIGSEVFGRARDYDTSQDNIVRVNATELRKRLDLYYNSEGIGEAIVIEIPRGGYRPVFRPRAAAGTTGPETPAHTAVREVSLAARFALPAAVACIAVLAAACVLLLAQNRMLRGGFHGWDAKSAVATFWQPFLNQRQRTDVILGDTSLSLIQDMTNHPIQLSAYLDRRFLDEVEVPGLSGDRRVDVDMVAGRHFGSFGDFQVAQRVMSLPFNNGAMLLQYAREYTPEAVKHNNVILIGGRRSNPWVELFSDRMNFLAEYDPKMRQSAIRNRSPRGGERAIYGLSPDPYQSDGYCVVAFLPNPSHSADAVIFAGTNAEATNAAGEFLTTEEPLAKFRKLLSRSKFPYFEVLLRTKRLAGTALSAEILAYRIYPE